jgi:hypothetical protein
MGEGVKIYCKNCNDNIQEENIFNYHFRLGIGMMFSPQHLFYGYDNKPMIFDVIKSKKIKTEIKSILENDSTPGDKYGYYIYYCQNCNFLDNQFYFSLNNNGIIYEPQYICKKCKYIMQPIYYKTENGNVIFYDLLDNKIKITCSNCHKSNFGKDITLMWD